ncbi:MAG TPA: hypothetical protein VKR61_02355 [Bryobacteraceae bacterium]|nr:hypothetical protein [Bryobacteraceae bacterium]
MVPLRLLAASGVPGDSTTCYFGSTGGGIWKSTDAATTLTPSPQRRP